MHSDNLCARGVPKSVFNYACQLEQMFQHDIICVYDKTSRFNDQLGIDKFSNRFPTYGYDKWSEVEGLLKAESIELLYTQNSGANDGKSTEIIPTLVHSVFQTHQPHGAVYAYISEWLASVMPGNHGYVPYMVEAQKPVADLRAELGIPAGALVFGRHGADTQFNIEFAQEGVHEIAKNNRDIYFLFLNTLPFCEELENIIHLPKTVDEPLISSFINACDAMLHARAMGESFGLAVAEFLSHDKPVVSFKGGNDKNHLYMMAEKGMWYTDKESLSDTILKFERLPKGAYKSCVNQFTPENVMAKFNQVFLNDFL
jgi:hypothetical protein